MSAPARRRTSRADRSEAGFTLVELMITMAVMSIVATSVMAVAFRSFTTTSTITNRRDVLTDGRTAIDQMTKQLRQGESVDQAASDGSSITFDSYIDGVPATIVWRVTGTYPYTVEQSRDGGANFAPLVSPIKCRFATDGCPADPFTYTIYGDYVAEVKIDLTFLTDTSSFELISDVHLRNAQE